MANSIITPSTQTTQLQDGVHFDTGIGEYRVIVGGKTVNYAFHWSTATNQYREACRVRREHISINPGEVL